MARNYKTDWKYGDKVTEEELNRMEKNTKELEIDLTPIIERNRIEEKEIGGGSKFDANYTICKIGKVAIVSIGIINYNQPEASKEININLPKPKKYVQVAYMAHTNNIDEVYGGHLYLDTDGTLTLYCKTGLIGLFDFTDITMVYEIGKEEV